MADNQSRDWHPLEYLHVFLWLIKDLCWAMHWVILGCIMVVPTVLSALIITIIQRKRGPVFIHNLSICFWISANSCWMVAEFFDWEEKLKPWSLVGFISGLAILVGFYGWLWVKKK